MYVVVSLIGAAETIIVGERESAKEHKIEDGEFTVFVPLSDKEKEKLTEKGITLEEMFYLDYEMKDESTIRVFQNREKIDKVVLDEGELPQKDGEVVLEKRYCEEHGLKVNDKIKIGEKEYQITGIGSVPDYSAAYKNISDSSVDSEQFGIAFVTKESYQELKRARNSQKSEEYVYAYLLNGKLTNKELKEEIKKIDFSAEDVTDTYFQEYWEETAGQKEKIQDGIDTLASGSKELENGLTELDSHGETLNDGTAQVFDTYLSEAQKALQAYGMTKDLTEDNFESVLNEYKNASDNGLLRLELSSAIQKLKALKAYKDGTKEYTKGVNEAANGAGELADGIQELKENANELLDKYFQVDISNLTQFLTAEDNPRIGAASDDQIVNKVSGLVAGIIVMILFAYVISVFVVHGIEKESSVIGALYSLGVKKGDLLLHYLTLPVIVTVISSLIGTGIGLSPVGITVQMQDCYAYYSIPKFQAIYPAYLLIYSLVVPFSMAVFVNWLVIRKKLSKPALQLMRKEQKTGKISNINLGNMGFVGRFRVRQMLREMRTGFTVIFGMFIALLILMIGVDGFLLCENISVQNKEDTKYQYMYTYKYPEKEVPESGEESYAKTLKKEVFGYNLDVTVLGIHEDNPYFNAKVEKGKNKVIISSAMAQKYNLKTGDKVILTDEEEDIDYAFTVEGITQYSPGFYAFMDIDSMRELFNVSDDYYNVVFADKKLDIQPERLYATTTKASVEKSSDVFKSMMTPMFSMLIGMGALIFCVVMYLMMKVMIDRSTFGISLIKIFGYRMKEVRKLYLNGNFYIIAVGAAICIPLSKKVMDVLYPALVSNVSCGMDLHFTWQLYLGIYVGVLLLYFIINQLLIRKIKKVVPAEVLKNRE